MFFLKKNKPVRNKLPENLVALKHAPEPSWVWDYEYRLIVWSNNAGLKFWNVDSREEIKELIFPENNSMVVTCDSLVKKLKTNKTFSEVIIFPTRPIAQKLKCDILKQELPDGRYGVLITIRTPMQIHPSQNNPFVEETADNHQESEIILNTPIQPKDPIAFPNFDEIEPEKPNLQSSSHTIMVSKPATLTCQSDGLIVSVNDIARSVLDLQEGRNYRDLFIDAPDTLKHTLNRILDNSKLSFVQKMNIGYGTQSYLVQTNQFKINNKLHFNMGILQISEKQYHEFLQNNDDTVVPTQAGASDNKKKPLVSLADDKYLSSSLVGDMTGIGLFNVTKDGIIKAANQMASNLVGIKYEDLVGKSIIDMFGADAIHVLRELIINNNHAVLSDLEQGVRCQYEDNHHVEHIAKLIVRPNRADNGFWFILNDMTELESIKNELSDLKGFKSDNIPATVANSQAIKMSPNAPIPHLVNAVSHEIRAPLNAIAGYAEMIEAEIFGALPDNRYKEFAQSIRGAGQYALSIVNELLDYSKLKAGCFTPEFGAVDVDKIALEAIEIVYPQAKVRNIEIIKTILTGTPFVNSDARLLKQILINLLTNAIKYSNDNEQILLTAGLTKTGRVMIEITDFGRGMTKQEIHDALVPFNNVNQDKTIPSTGLGLCLAKELTELTHGRLMIDSVPNEKTRVRIIYEKTSLLD